MTQYKAIDRYQVSEASYPSQTGGDLDGERDAWRLLHPSSTSQPGTGRQSGTACARLCETVHVPLPAVRLRGARASPNGVVAAISPLRWLSRHLTVVLKTHTFSLKC